MDSNRDASIPWQQAKGVSCCFNPLAEISIPLFMWTHSRAFSREHALKCLYIVSANNKFPLIMSDKTWSQLSSLYFIFGSSTVIKSKRTAFEKDILEA